MICIFSIALSCLSSKTSSHCTVSDTYGFERKGSSDVSFSSCSIILVFPDKSVNIRLNLPINFSLQLRLLFRIQQQAVGCAVPSSNKQSSPIALSESLSTFNN